ncbi:MAG TPA: hypothetical protein IGS17_17100 [Oscillatoriales cyanobacterium M59_W2019_021]|nr:hypothetical protein [Oscillatoriales cyanobacterium M4454_W2019_049]HIK52624.1 hypothetical protein [Oscillatoriales cyanobacterium M59_W2019_021]
MRTLIFGFLRASFLSFILFQPTVILAQVAPEDPTPTDGELEDRPKPAVAPTSESESIPDESESSPVEPALQKKPPPPEEPADEPTLQPKPIPETESASPEPLLEKPSPPPEEPTIEPQPEPTPEPEPTLAPATPSESIAPTLQPDLTVPQSELTTPTPTPTPEATPEAIPTPAASPRVAPLPSLLSPQQTIAPSPGASPPSPQPSPQTSPPVASPNPLNRVPTRSPSPRATPLVPISPETTPETPSQSRSGWWIPVGLIALLLAGIPLFLWQKRRSRSDAALLPSEPIPPLPSLDGTGMAGSSHPTVKGNGSLRMNVDRVAMRTKFDPGRQSLKSPASLVDRSANGTIDKSQD